MCLSWSEDNEFFEDSNLYGEVSTNATEFASELYLEEHLAEVQESIGKVVNSYRGGFVGPAAANQALCYALSVLENPASDLPSALDKFMKNDRTDGRKRRRQDDSDSDSLSSEPKPKVVRSDKDKSYAIVAACFGKTLFSDHPSLLETLQDAIQHPRPGLSSGDVEMARQMLQIRQHSHWKELDDFCHALWSVKPLFKKTNKSVMCYAAGILCGSIQCLNGNKLGEDGNRKVVLYRLVSGAKLERRSKSPISSPTANQSSLSNYSEGVDDADNLLDVLCDMV